MRTSLRPLPGVAYIGAPGANMTVSPLSLNSSSSQRWKVSALSTGRAAIR